MKAAGKQRCSPAFSSVVSLLSRSVGTFQAWLKVWLMFELLTVHLYKPASFIFKRAGGDALLVLVTANKTGNKLTEYLCTLYCLTTYSSPSLRESALSLCLTDMHAPGGICACTHAHSDFFRSLVAGSSRGEWPFSHFKNLFSWALISVYDSFSEVLQK